MDAGKFDIIILLFESQLSRGQYCQNSVCTDYREARQHIKRQKETQGNGDDYKHLHLTVLSAILFIEYHSKKNLFNCTFCKLMFSL